MLSWIAVQRLAITIEVDTFVLDLDKHRAVLAISHLAQYALVDVDAMEVANGSIQSTYSAEADERYPGLRCRATFAETF